MTDPAVGTALAGEVASEVLERCRPIAERFSERGYRLHLVGGIVRDLLLAGAGADRSIVDELDLDFTTDARPNDIKAVVAPLATSLWTQGERFGTIGATIGGRLVEITTHRAEAYDPASRKPTVAFGDDVRADLARRDFTVNAIAVELTAAVPTVEDPFGGRADLAAGRLRTPIGAHESFGDDPLRMLRAARFMSKLGLEPTVDVVEAATSMAGRIDVVSAERVRDELDKLLVTDDPARGLAFLVDTGLAARVVPELAAPDPGPRVERIARATDRVARWALMVGDDGSAAARRRLGALRCARRDVDEVVDLLRAAEDLERGVPDSDADLRRFVARHGSPHRAVELAVSRRRAAGGSLDELLARHAALAAREDLDDLGPALDGGDVIAHLGVEPGPVVGDALEHLRELRVEGGPMTRAEALTALDEWWRATTDGRGEPPR